MHLATRSSMGLAQLAILAASSPLPLPLPLRPAHAISVLSYIPEDIVWHQTNLVTVNATNGSPAFPMVGGNVTACTHVTYDEVSPARTSVVREDCADLAEQVKSTPGFWELCNWSDDKSGDFRALVSNGTCEFAVKRRGTPSGFNTSNSDVAIVGNQDVFRIINASVHDFAATADEPYVDAERNQGHMSCKWWSTVNTSLEFRIQKTGAQ